MKNKKLSLHKITITKLNNLNRIKGGFTLVDDTESQGQTCTGISTKTNEDNPFTEDGRP
ncbi:hypothetical protein [Aquimarina sp. AD10]|uniref:hypothetical protein n=1 Tax=Aquimarina sp. AD10 TaxID=1714849 RepID=UPI0013149B10|nr:hypothetical protein [Aquimarina sp. AD10]